ncbi:MAG: PVC-type heme-binding CxxCH protein [Verrucomicrobiota bacterium]
MSAHSVLALKIAKRLLLILIFFTSDSSRVTLAAAPPDAPSPPVEALKSFRLADANLIIERVASEPEVVSPVAMAFDADGNLFVAEMSDYPKGPPGGRIRFLQDRDGDGEFEHALVYAEQLPFPNGVLPWNGGVLVTAAPDILFLRDTNGDGQADERRVLFTGFGTGNQQLRVNGLTWGLDNWVYGANGRNDGEIRRADSPDAPSISIRRRDFRFQPATGEFESLAGPSQFGCARNDWGDRFLSWNTILIRHVVIEQRYLNRNPFLTNPESIQNLAPPDEAGEVFPLTPAPLVFNEESSSHFNALAGLTLFRGDALGPEYAGNAFAGESLRNLVHRRSLVDMGVTFRALRTETKSEFLASTDPWFHPVNFATGPDGALYVADFYRRFVEHPDYVHDKSVVPNVPWREGAEHGRIWRIRSKEKSASSRVALSRMTSNQLAAMLSHPNAWRRDTAQRLLIERQDRSVVPLLASSLTNRSANAWHRVHSLWILEGMNSLPDALLRTVLTNADVEVRRQALLLVGSHLNDPAKWTDLLTQATRDSNLRVAFQAVLTIGSFPEPIRNPVLVEAAVRHAHDSWFALAILSAPNTSFDFTQRLIARASDFREPHRTLAFWEELGRQIARKENAAETIKFLRALGSMNFSLIRTALFAGFCRDAHRAKLKEMLSQPEVDAALRKTFAKMSSELVLAAINEIEPLPLRTSAARALSNVGTEADAPKMLNLLQPATPRELQSAAVPTLAELADRSVIAALLKPGSAISPARRRELIAALARQSSKRVLMVEALETGDLQLTELDPASRQALQTENSPEIKSRIAKLLASSEKEKVGRQEWIEKFRPALHLEGDTARGWRFFEKNCLPCHRFRGQGNTIGPDLSAVGTRPKESLLDDILDPSRNVSPDYLSYRILTTDGESLNGLIVQESAASLTLRRASGPDETLSRSRIKEIRSEGKSLMPDGFEQGMSLQDLADLLAFLKRGNTRSNED